MIDLPLVKQPADHAGHGHHPREHRYQREEGADAVQEPVGTVRSASTTAPRCSRWVLLPRFVPLSLRPQGSLRTKTCQTLCLGQNRCRASWFIGVQTHRARGNFTDTEALLYVCKGESRVGPGIAWARLWGPWSNQPGPRESGRSAHTCLSEAT